MKNERYIKYGLFTSILIALGPIIWLFFNIYNKSNEFKSFNIVLIIISFTLVLFFVKRYLELFYKERKKKIKILIKLVDFIFFILLIATIGIGFIFFYVLIAIIQEKLFVRGEYLTYINKSPYSYLRFLVFAIVLNNLKILWSKNGIKFIDKIELGLLKKVNKISNLIIIPMLYLIITEVVVVTEDGIYDYSFYNLKGSRYEFSEVKNVETGFKNKGRSKGEFFYNIKIEDGKIMKLAHPSLGQASDRYIDDSWQEYVDIDKYIMKNGAEKESSEKGVEHVLMEQVYIDKLLEVVRNK